MHHFLPKKIRNYLAKKGEMLHIFRAKEGQDISRDFVPSIQNIQLSDIHIKTLKFFYENQSSIDTPRGISTWIREDRSKVKRALEDLVKMKALVADRATSTTGYSITRDQKMLDNIEKILKTSSA